MYRELNIVAESREPTDSDKPGHVTRMDGARAARRLLYASPYTERRRGRPRARRAHGENQIVSLIEAISRENVEKYFTVQWS